MSKQIFKISSRFEGAVVESELVSHPSPLLQIPPGLLDLQLQLVKLIIKHRGGCDPHRGLVCPEEYQITLFFIQRSFYSHGLGIHVVDLVGLGQDPGLLDEGYQVVVAGLQVPATFDVAKNVPPCLLVDISRLN